LDYVKGIACEKGKKKEKKKIDLNKKKKVSLKICITGSKFNSKIYE
jgi:hypothetical protein